MVPTGHQIPAADDELDFASLRGARLETSKALSDRHEGSIR